MYIVTKMDNTLNSVITNYSDYILWDTYNHTRNIVKGAVVLKMLLEGESIVNTYRLGYNGIQGIMDICYEGCYICFNRVGCYWKVDGQGTHIYSGGVYYNIPHELDAVTFRFTKSSMFLEVSLRNSVSFKLCKLRVPFGNQTGVLKCGDLFEVEGCICERATFLRKVVCV